MKKFTTYLVAFAAMIAATVSCVNEENLYQKGDPDLEGTFGVYFPTQEITSETQIYAPDDDLSATIVIKRLNNHGAVTVPVKATTSHDDIFLLPDLVFADGQTETSYTFSFAKAAEKPGTTYTLSLEIVGDEYIYKYGEHTTAVEFSCLVEKWSLIKSGEATKATVKDAVLTQVFNATINDFGVELYRSEVDRNKYRLANYFPELSKVAMLGGYPFYMYTSYYTQAGGHFEFELVEKGEVFYPGKDYEFTVDTEDFVDFATRTPTCAIHPSYGQVYYRPSHAYEDWPAVADSKVTQWQEVDLLDANGKVVEGDDGKPLKEKIPAVISLRPYAAVSAGPFGFGNMTIIFPGQKLADNSVKVGVARNLDEDGKIEVSFKLGDQAEEVYYKVFEGDLASALVSVHASDMANAIKAGKTSDLTQVETTSTHLLEMDKSGDYTIIAVSMGLAEDDPFKTSYVSFGYEKDNDGTGATELLMELAPTDKNPDDYTSSDALEFLIAGSSIRDIRYDLYKTSHVEGKSDDALMAALHANDDDLDQSEVDANLDAVNGKGLTGVFSDLAAGTDYTLVICTYNGYEEVISKISASTKGKYNPIQDMDLSYLDMEPVTALPDGEWACFARTLDVTQKKASTYPSSKHFKAERELLSESVKAGNTTVEVYDQSGNVALAPRFTLDGLYKKHSDVQGMDSKTYFEADAAGFMWLCDEYKLFLAQTSLTKAEYAFATVSPLHSGYNAGFLAYGDEMFCGMIANTDGQALAIIDYPGSKTLPYLASGGYPGEFYGLALEVYNTNSDWLFDLAWYANPVIVNPKKYDISGYKESDKPAAGSSKARVTQLQKPNYVESNAGTVLAAQQNAAPLSLKHHLVLNEVSSDSNVDFTVEVVEYRDVEFDINEIRPVEDAVVRR